MSLDVGQLYETTHPALCAYFGARLAPAHRHMAEDFASDVFVRVLRAADGFEDRGLPTRAWLFKIARNLLTDHYRAIARRDDEASLEGGELHPPDARAGRAYADADNAATAGALLAVLTPDQRAVIRLRFGYGYTEPEIGRMLGASADAIMLRRRRAISRMRSLLEGAA